MMDALQTIDLTVYMIPLLTFLVVILLVEGGYYLWRSMQFDNSGKVKRRLRKLSAAGMESKEALSLLNQNQLSNILWLNRILVSIPRMHALDRALEQAGIDATVSRFMLLQLVMLVALAVVLRLAGQPYAIALPLSLIAGISLPWLYVSVKQRKRRELFTAQLPDALDYLTRSLKAGNPFTAALKSLSVEMPQPIAGEFAITFDELNFGLDTEAALHNLAQRTGSEEIRYFIAAVLIQRQTGGNLADVLKRIAQVMRSRQNMRREVWVLAAEMQYSARVLIFLPFLVALLMLLTNREYIMVLFEHELGYVIIGLQILLMAVGYSIIHRMINFRV
ncbi:MAG TPA: type II secretion system F family protein [Pseudomonadales bacterium]